MITTLDGSSERGQYLLAGSTRFLSTRTLSETLTGRVGLAELLPLSMVERLGVRETFLDRLFDGDLPTGTSALARAEYAALIACGGFPEMVLGPTTRRFRATWCDSYLRTVTAFANVEQAAEVRRPELIGQLFEQVAVRSTGEVVVADLARELQASEGLINSYLDDAANPKLVGLLEAGGPKGEVQNAWPSGSRTGPTTAPDHCPTKTSRTGRSSASTHVEVRSTGKP